MAGPLDRWMETSAHDGASAPIGVDPTCNPSEVDSLIEAWSRERQDSTESRFLLGRARRLLRRILAEGEVTASSSRSIRHLLGLIDTFADGDRDIA